MEWSSALGAGAVLDCNTSDRLNVETLECDISTLEGKYM